MKHLIPLLALLALGTGCSAKKQLADAQSKAATCETDLASARAQVGDLEKKLKDAALAQALTDKRLAAYKDLAKRLRDAYGTDLEIEIRNGRMVVKLPNAILYDTGKSELKEEGKKSLAKLAGVLKAEERNFQVAGHTDNQPVSGKSTAYKTNWELSTQRALSAVYYMEKSGMKATRLAAAGYGEHQPLAKNDTPENMAQNRRTELVIMPRLDEVPTFPKDL